MRIHRGKLDFGRWCSKFDVMKLRLNEAWMDTCELAVLKPGETSDKYQEEIRDCLRSEGRTDQMGSLSSSDKIELVNKHRKEDHQKNFPFNDNLFAMLFLLQSDLNDQQRLSLVSQFRMQKVGMKQWTHQLIKD